MCYRMEDKDAKARRAVRTNNFTQQTNALDVDKHMCATFQYLPQIYAFLTFTSRHAQDGLHRREHEASTCPKLIHA